MKSQTFKSQKKTIDQAALSEWWHKIEEWRSRQCLSFNQSPEGEIKPQQVIETLYKVTNGDAFITSDVGQHQMWAA